MPKPASAASRISETVLNTTWSLPTGSGPVSALAPRRCCRIIRAQPMGGGPDQARARASRPGRSRSRFTKTAPAAAMSARTPQVIA